MVLLILLWLTINSTFDLIIDNIQAKHLQHLDDIIIMQQQVLILQKDKITNITKFENEMYQLYYAVAKLAIDSKLKTDIIHDELRKAAKQSRENKLIYIWI